MEDYSKSLDAAMEELLHLVGNKPRIIALIHEVEELSFLLGLERSDDLPGTTCSSP